MTIQYKGIQIFYTDSGEGTPVVLLHGFLENSTMWNSTIRKLSKTNRVICMDLLGHGHTGCLGYVHTMEMMADAVVAVLHHLNIQHHIIIGHSMGGYVALAYAEKNPAKILGLCLMNSTAQADSKERQENRDRAILAVKQDHKKFVGISIVNLFRPKNRKIFAQEIKLIKQEALKTPVQGIIAALEGMKIRKDRERLLKESPFKKLMVISKKDPVLNFDGLMEQAKDSNTQVEVLPDGHMSHVENKSLFLQIIMQFVENI